MNKEIFLRDLRNLLSDLSAEEREQAINYYEDYFADAGAENEQQVIKELGSPLDIANQIKSSTQENIEYGKGNAFHTSDAYPDLQNSTQQQSQSNGYQQTQGGQTNQKKNWTQDSTKVTLLIVLALLAAPVGIPVITTVASILFGIFVAIVSIIFAMFVTAIGLIFSGIISVISGFALLASSSIANAILLLGVGLILASLGFLLFWFMLFFCKKFFPAFFTSIERACSKIAKGIKNFFN